MDHTCRTMHGIRSRTKVCCMSVCGNIALMWGAGGRGGLCAVGVGMARWAILWRRARACMRNNNFGCKRHGVRTHLRGVRRPLALLPAEQQLPLPRGDEPPAPHTVHCHTVHLLSPWQLLTPCTARVPQVMKENPYARAQAARTEQKRLHAKWGFYPVFGRAAHGALVSHTVHLALGAPLSPCTMCGYNYVVTGLRRDAARPVDLARELRSGRGE